MHTCWLSVRRNWRSFINMTLSPRTLRRCRPTSNTKYSLSWKTPDVRQTGPVSTACQRLALQSIVVFIKTFICVLSISDLSSIYPKYNSIHHRDAPILHGWRLPMKQLTWLRIIHSWDWCLHLMALCADSGACQKWMNDRITVSIECQRLAAIRTVAAVFTVTFSCVLSSLDLSSIYPKYNGINIMPKVSISYQDCCSLYDIFISAILCVHSVSDKYLLVS